MSQGNLVGKLDHIHCQQSSNGDEIWLYIMVGTDRLRVYLPDPAWSTGLILGEETHIHCTMSTNSGGVLVAVATAPPTQPQVGSSASKPRVKAQQLKLDDEISFVHTNRAQIAIELVNFPGMFDITGITLPTPPQPGDKVTLLVKRIGSNPSLYNVLAMKILNSMAATAQATTPTPTKASFRGKIVALVPLVDGHHFMLKPRHDEFIIDDSRGKNLRDGDTVEIDVILKRKLGRRSYWKVESLTLIPRTSVANTGTLPRAPIPTTAPTPNSYDLFGHIKLNDPASKTCPSPGCNKEALVKSDLGNHLICWKCGYKE